MIHPSRLAVFFVACVALAVVPGPAVRVTGTVSGDAPTVTVNGVAATVSGGNWEVAALALEADVANPLAAVARDRQGHLDARGAAVRAACSPRRRRWCRLNRRYRGRGMHRCRACLRRRPQRRRAAGFYYR